MLRFFDDGDAEDARARPAVEHDGRVARGVGGACPETVMLVRLAALVAVDAPTASYLLNLGIASELSIEVEETKPRPAGNALHAAREAVLDRRRLLDRARRREGVQGEREGAAPARDAGAREPLV